MKTVGTRVIRYVDSQIIEQQTDSVAKPQEIIVVGFIVSETENYITLAREIIGNEYRGQISIPKEAIL